MDSFDKLNPEQLGELVKDEETAYRPHLLFDKDCYSISFCTFIAYYRKKF